MEQAKVDLIRDVDKLKDSTVGIKYLRTITMLDHFSEDELKELYLLGEIKIHNAKANVIIEGENSRGLYILLQGMVSVYKADNSSDSLIRLAMLEVGAVFGELSLFDDAPRSATVTAEYTCALFYLGVESFDKFLNDKGDSLKVRFYKKCAEDMVERFRKQNSDYLISQQLLWKHALRKESIAEEKTS